MKFSATLFVFLVLTPFWAHSAQAQTIRRCTATDGRVVTTDKPCAAINATDRVPRVGVGAVGLRRPYRSVCARNLDELSYEVASAIDLGDANRLAGIYHWVGMDGAQAYRVFTRLENLVKRPLMDIGPTGGSASGEPVWQEDAEGNLVPVFPKPRPPTGLKIEQTIALDNVRTARTVFGLRRHMGCLWVTF